MWLQRDLEGSRQEQKPVGTLSQQSRQEMKDPALELFSDDGKTEVRNRILNQQGLEVASMQE